MFVAVFACLALGVLGATVDYDGRSSCPVGWLDATYVDMGCVIFSNSTYMTWLEANVYCQRYENGQLLEIHDELQLDFLLMETNNFADYDEYRVWWIGGTDIDHEGKWTWESSGLPIKDFIWSSKQPDGGTDQNCLDLEYTNYLAHDTRCNNLYYPICQFLI